LRSCGFFRRGSERADEETQHADAAPNCGLRAQVQRLDEWGRSREERREADVQRNELVSMLTQWPAACLAFAGCGLAGLVRVMFDA
jgi:hypothetical protein